MPKVILICGKICCGKSTYVEKLRKEIGAVVLSTDEIMLTIFGEHSGKRHDEYCQNLQNYLFEKSLELIETGINVILDWGFWRRKDREFAKKYYQSHNVEWEFHYLNISDDVWRERLNKRNGYVEKGKIRAYYIDENLAEKFESAFEAPMEKEIEVWIND